MKTPNRHEITAANNYMDKGKVERANDLLIENWVLDGDMATIDQYGVVFGEIIEWGSDQVRSCQPYQSKKL